MNDSTQLFDSREEFIDKLADFLRELEHGFPEIIAKKRAHSIYALIVRGVNDDSATWPLAITSASAIRGFPEAERYGVKVTVPRSAIKQEVSTRNYTDSGNYTFNTDQILSGITITSEMHQPHQYYLSMLEIDQALKEGGVDLLLQTMEEQHLTPGGKRGVVRNLAVSINKAKERKPGTHIIEPEVLTRREAALESLRTMEL